MDIKSLLALFNVAARTDFNRAYQTVEPQIKGLLYEYPSGPVEKMSFPFLGFLSGMAEFTGTAQFEEFPDGYKFDVTNKEYQMGVSIRSADIERAANVGTLAGLQLYKQRISEMPQQAKDHPNELALDMLEVGDAATYGTCFDGQNLFDTTHDFSLSAGTQINITAGTGVTVATLLVDLGTAINMLNSFTYNQGGTGNSKKRKLNKTIKLLVVCPDQLFSLFESIRVSALISGSDNPLKGRFELISRPFTDPSD